MDTRGEGSEAERGEESGGERGRGVATPPCFP